MSSHRSELPEQILLKARDSSMPGAMKLPNFQRAVVDDGKIVDYLLNAAHPDNGGKAQFFKMLGYTIKKWPLLGTEFASFACNTDVTEKLETPRTARSMFLSDHLKACLAKVVG